MTEQQTKAKPDTIQAVVTFPIAAGGPFRGDFAPETAVGTIRGQAMNQFGVAEDGQHAYYVTHAGAKVSDDTVLGDVAGNARSVKFTLVKELLQG